MENRLGRFAAPCAIAVFLMLTLPASAEAQTGFIANEFHYRCLSVDGGSRVETSSCDVSPQPDHFTFGHKPGTPTNWRFLRAYANGTQYCFEAGEESVLWRECNFDNPFQVWIIESHWGRQPAPGMKGIRIRSLRDTALCIDNYEKNRVRLWQCGNSLQQQWNIFGSVFEWICPNGSC